MDQDVHLPVTGEPIAPDPRAIAPFPAGALPAERSEAPSLAEERRLRRIAAGLLSRQHDREDLVQDVWIQLLEGREARGRSDGWLRVVSIHTAQRLVRSVRSRETRERRAARPDRLPSVLEEFERDALREELRRWIEALDEPYREVLRLRYLDERSTAEIAGQLARSEGTVRSQLKRGLDRLREQHERRGAGRSRLLGLAGLFGRRGIRADSNAGRGLQAGLALASVAALASLIVLTRDSGRVTDSVAMLAAPRGSSASDDAGRGPRSVGTPRAARDARAPTDLAPAAPPALATADAPRLQGRVIDVFGAPIEGAEVWTAQDGEAASAHMTARSGPDGSYELEPRGSELWIWAEALANGLTPRHLVSSPAMESSAAPTLLFQVNYGPLVGVLHDSGGEPVAGAEVRAFLLGEAAPTLGPQGVQRRNLGGVPRLTDTAGRFELPRISASELALLVTPPGGAPSVHGIDGFDQAPLVLRLPPPASLEGELRASGGSPAGGAHVRLERPRPLPPAETVADSAGRFRFEAQAAGPFTLIAVDEAAAISAVFEAELGEGEELALDPLDLTDAYTVRGRARGGAGPLAGWIVSLENEGASALRSTRCAEDGSFAFAGCAGGGHTLRLHAPDAPGGAPHDLARGVRPGSPGVELCSSPDRAPSARVSAALAPAGLPDGSPVVVRAMHYGRQDEALSIPVRPDSSSFELGPLAPGAYVLTATHARLGTWELARLTLGPSERVDLGTLHAPRTGSLVVSWTQPTSTETDTFRLLLRGQGVALQTWQHLPSPRVDIDPAARIARFHQLLPGEYALGVQGPRVARIARTLRIVEGEEHAVELELREGRPVELRVSAARPLRRGEALELHVHTPEGTLELPVDDLGALPAALLQLRVSLAPGEHRAEARTSGGLAADLELVVPPDAPRLVAPLHLE